MGRNDLESTIKTIEYVTSSSLGVNIPFLLRLGNEMIVVGLCSTEGLNFAPIITVLLFQGPFLSIADLTLHKDKSSKLIIQLVSQLVIQ